ncbi:hypothetical protein SAMN04487969_11175 [Paenibacillus algorifonticola]|uniref:TolB-like 6-blade propeller-like n=2 Tax=Paenibacillus algorifonticola TaxID=684063 RepID=A0A1I2F680_9BACL|nr:hypothetical protein SAMN04487969_11175 [Paenibacillus algorifonticola]
MPNMLILSAMLLFFVCCIYGVSDLYMLSKGNSRTILLSDKQFAGKLTVPPDSTVKIESIIRQVYDFPIYLFKAIDHNSVVIISPDRSFSGNKLSMLWLEENKIKDIAGNVSYVINLLRKEKGLIYTQYGQDWDVKSAYLYDLSNSKISLYPYNAVESLLFISEDSYIGFDGESFNLLQDGGEKKRMLYSYEELSNLVAEKNDLKQSVDVQILLESLQLSYEQKDVYFLVQMNEKAVIYRFDVNKKNGITIMASGQGIEQFKVLGNGNLLLYGTIEGTKGLFMYDKNTATYKLLKEGVIWGIAVDEEQTRVAYFSGEDSKNNEIHVAYLEGNKLLYDTVIYRNLEGLPTLQWSKNDLFVSGRVINRTEFLRFTLNAW